LDEQNKTNRLKDYMLFGVMSGIVGMPISLYLGMKARKNPSLRSRYIKMMALIPTGPLFVVLISGFFAEKNYRYLCDKYFAHLSDTDLDNFENYYHLLKGGLPPGIRSPQPYLYGNQNQQYQQPPQLFIQQQ
jgi:hypothetical protein